MDGNGQIIKCMFSSKQNVYQTQQSSKNLKLLRDITFLLVFSKHATFNWFISTALGNKLLISRSLTFLITYSHPMNNPQCYLLLSCLRIHV